MPMYSSIEHNDNFSNIWGSFLQYYRDDPNDNIT